MGARAAKWWTLRIWVIILAQLHIFTASFALSGAENAVDRSAVIFLKGTCVDKDLGDVQEPEGTGFFISQNGYIVTAAHTFLCLVRQNDGKMKQYELHNIIGSIGSRDESVRGVYVVSLNEKTDVAILKLKGLNKGYSALEVCTMPQITQSLEFLAAGFPLGVDYQSVEGIIGNENAPGGLWAAAAPFVGGMSGGPVVWRKRVVGIIKSGIPGVVATSRIIPIFRAVEDIKVFAGISISTCPTEDVIVSEKSRIAEFDWVELVGVTISGGRTTVETKNRCAAICVQNPACAAYVYNSSTKQCELKSRYIGALVPKDGTGLMAEYTSGVRTKAKGDALRITDIPVYEMENDCEWERPISFNQGKQSLNGCVSICNNALSCKAFTHFSSGICITKITAIGCWSGANGARAGFRASVNLISSRMIVE